MQGRGPGWRCAGFFGAEKYYAKVAKRLLRELLKGLHCVPRKPLPAGCTVAPPLAQKRCPPQCVYEIKDQATEPKTSAQSQGGDRQMRRFKSTGYMQRSFSVHGPISSFRLGRHLMNQMQSRIIGGRGFAQRHEVTFAQFSC